MGSFLPLLSPALGSGGIPMLYWRRPIFLLILFNAVWLSGCRRSQANPAPARQSAAKSQSPTAPAPKHAPRDSAHSVYNNPSYGVSFRYPGNYLLAEEFDSEDPSILKSRPGPAEPQPGPILVVTINIPRDAYPYTTFESGTLQFVVNPTVTAEACRAFASPKDEYFTSGSRPIQGVTFHWRERGSAAGTGFDNRDYSAFANGACYEFYLEIVTDSNPDADPRIKEADNPKIMRQLDKIVSSLQLHNPQPSSRPL